MSNTGNYKSKFDLLGVLQARHREKVEFYDSLSDEDRKGELGELTLDEINELRARIWRRSHDLGVKSNLRFTRAEKRAVLLGCIGGSIMALAVFGLIIGIVMSV